MGHELDQTSFLTYFTGQKWQQCHKLTLTLLTVGVVRARSDRITRNKMHINYPKAHGNNKMYNIDINSSKLCLNLLENWVY